eukprot:TRINITY_DN67324_c9_g3_i1.p1 TRINITY_DN67324_c9_g3~~TRINITY_DN67324_c9_g3_i1.p1  ORF type:complete len:498 (-),score=10.26 TRINITY_DN67324_c9_g3_i1:60-1553(-)
MPSVEDDLGYSPAPSVVAAHNIPHLDRSLNPVSHDFDSSSEYVESIIVFPCVLLALGILSLFIYHFVCCCLVCKCCGPFICVDKITKETKNVTPERVQSIVSKRRLAIGFFFFFLIGLVVSNNMFVEGNKFISKGSDEVVEVLDYLKGLTSDMVDQSSTLADVVGNMTDSLNAAVSDGCTSAQSPIDMLDIVQDGSDSTADLLDDVPDAMEDAKEFFITYAEDRKNEIMDITYYVGWFFIVLYMIGIVCRSKTYYRFLIAFSGLLVLVLTFICCVEMIVVTFLGDVCMEPNTILLDELADSMGGVNDPNSTYSMVKYYFTCEGNGPLDNYITTSFNEANNLNNTLYQLITNSSDINAEDACVDNDDLKDAFATMPDVYNILDEFFDSISCTPTRHILYKLINNGFCEYTVSGVFTIWVGLFVFSGVLFLLNFVAGILYQYFDPIMWDIGSKPIASLIPVDNDDDIDNNNKVEEFENVAPPLSPNSMEMVKQNQVAPL